MNPQQLAAWINREPAAPGSAGQRRALLALGQAFEHLEARHAAKPLVTSPASVEVPCVKSSTEVAKSKRRGPYRRRLPVA